MWCLRTLEALKGPGRDQGFAERRVLGSLVHLTSNDRLTQSRNEHGTVEDRVLVAAVPALDVEPEELSEDKDRSPHNSLRPVEGWWHVLDN